MTSFGPNPIHQLPGAIQSSFIAQHATAPKPREKTKPQEGEAPRVRAKDEVTIADPVKGDEIDPKPNAVEEWKHRRPRDKRREHAPDAEKPRTEGDGEKRLDIRA